MEELISVAPMMGWSTPQWRYLLRLISKKAVLYSEMLVDDTIIHNCDGLDRFLGLNDKGPSVIQLGGSNPETLGIASEILQQYGIGSDHYQEVNLNCGCPSDKVSTRCFGAKLMLQPDLVRRIVATISRRVSCPVTVKCRLGVANHRDTYEHLHEFITEAHAGGANKFIIHARDCVLEGLTTKQNRDIPPLRYEEVRRLRRDFPDLTFILNGGIQNIPSALEQMGRGTGGEEGEEETGSNAETCSFAHGVMMGRAVWNNPLVLADVDSSVYKCRRDPCLTRRQMVLEYGEHCDALQERAARVISASTRDTHSTPAAIQSSYKASLTAGLCNIFSGVKNNKEFTKRMHHTIGPGILISDYIQEAMTSIFADEILDEPVGELGVD